MIIDGLVFLDFMMGCLTWQVPPNIRVLRLGRGPWKGCCCDQGSYKKEKRKHNIVVPRCSLHFVFGVAIEMEGYRLLPFWWRVVALDQFDITPWESQFPEFIPPGFKGGTKNPKQQTPPVLKWFVVVPKNFSDKVMYSFCTMSVFSWVFCHSWSHSGGRRGKAQNWGPKTSSGFLACSINLGESWRHMTDFIPHEVAQMRNFCDFFRVLQGNPRFFFECPGMLRREFN